MMRTFSATICRFSCLTAIIGACTLWPAAAGCNDAALRGPSSASASRSVGQWPQDQALIHVYFADRIGHYLQAEERVIASTTNGVEKGRLIIKALIKGPKTELVRTVPSETRLNAFYIAPGGRAYIDLSENVFIDSPGGSRTELLTVYSIVNSLVLNMAEVSSVKILVSGSETSTLSGHIDNRYPFSADMLLIR